MGFSVDNTTKVASYVASPTKIIDDIHTPSTATSKSRTRARFRPFVKSAEELTSQLAGAVKIAKEKPAGGPPCRAPNMAGECRLVARVITDERFTGLTGGGGGIKRLFRKLSMVLGLSAGAQADDASLEGLELEVGDKDCTVAPPYAAWLEKPSGRDKNAEPFAPAPSVVLREGLDEAKLDTLDAHASWASLVSRGSDAWALGWACDESERDVHAYTPHDVFTDRARAGGFDTGVVLHDDRATTVLYDAALPLRETGLIERDEATEAQLQIAKARTAAWGAMLAPEAVRARRVAKLATRFGAPAPPPAFFREYVRVDDSTPRSDKAADAAYWAALSAAGAPYVVLPTGPGTFGKKWPAPVWGVCAAYEKRHGPPPTAHTAKIARSDWRA